MRMLCDALEELGHSAIVSHNGLVADHINILFAAHTISDPRVVEQITGAGLDYIVLQSEVVRQGQVNLTGDLDHFDRCYRRGRAVQ